MDLMSAKTEAAARSQKSKKLLFIHVLDDGECGVSTVQDATATHAFEGGNEVPLPELTAPEEKPAKAKVAKAPTKKEKPKKMAKKAPAKKAAKAAAPAKKEKVSGLIGKATTLLLSKADWDKVNKAVEAGKGSIRDLASKGILKAL